ncbi:GNAT family N-acetyltransferase [Rheinheimera riviphila]|uniref:GNAT family N-acetyltransferase n=1 Tax=Rheinheimera riviphila TaxID=1834037 RepID=A0A437QT13_9GAMM|nr:GNAT family N-acetyltransferase [Rheinheimera riviphila]RVU37599.1 GNAT family N-acetyltransferase [Rheinheimera riviphila]
MTQHAESTEHIGSPATGSRPGFNLDGILYHCAGDWPDEQTVASLEPAAASGWPWLQQLRWFSQLKQFEQQNGVNQGSRYLLLQIYHHQQLLVLLPLRTSDDSHSLLALSNYYSPEFAPLMPDFVPALSSGIAPLKQTKLWPLLVAAISTLWPQWQQLRLQPLSQTTATQVQQQCPASIKTLVSPFGHNWRAAATNHTDYWQQRQSQLVNTIRRKKKKLLQQGAAIQIHRQLTPELLASYWHIYQRSWKQPEPSPDFINWLLEFSSQQGQLRLGLLLINDQPVAFQFWLVQQQQAAIVKLSQDQAFDTLSPGTVLMAAMIDEVMTQDNVTNIDFLTGNDDYKAQWMDECLPLLQLDLFHCQSLSGWLQYLTQGFRCKLRQLSTLRQRRQLIQAPGSQHD